MNLIVAVDNRWGIGKDNHLLANIPGDMQYFKEHTTGKVVIMGRKTLESMPGKRGLPNRTNYVLTGQAGFSAERAITVNSWAVLEEELKSYEPDDVFLIGGASMYNKYYKKCDKLFVTKIDADLGADTFITNFDEDSDYVVTSESKPVTENGLTYRFLVYQSVVSLVR